jgi:hypothetical protein
MAYNTSIDADLMADIYVAADVVGQEAVGFIPSVTMNAESTRAGKGDFIRAAFTQEASLGDIAESMTIADPSAVTIDEKALQMSNAKSAKFSLSGEDTRGLSNSGLYNTVYGDLVAQGMRKLINEMESDLFLAAKNGASRATDSTLSSTLNCIASARQILVDNGCPTDDLSLVANTTDGVLIRNNANLLSANQAGTDAVRDQGILIPVHGLNVRESSQIATHTKGTLAGTPLTDVTDAVDATSIAINGGTGSSTIVAGDVVQFGGAGNKHVVGTGTADASGGTIVLNQGLLAEVANDTAVAINADYLGSFAFHRRAIELAVRAPAMPAGGDAATDAVTVQDPRTGLVFEVRIYKGYHTNMIEVGAVWGVKAWKSNFIATII